MFFKRQYCCLIQCLRSAHILEGFELQITNTAALRQQIYFQISAMVCLEAELNLFLNTSGNQYNRGWSSDYISKYVRSPISKRRQAHKKSTLQ